MALSINVCTLHLNGQKLPVCFDVLFRATLFWNRRNLKVCPFVNHGFTGSRLMGNSDFGIERLRLTYNPRETQHSFAISVIFFAKRSWSAELPRLRSSSTYVSNSALRAR